MDTTYEGAIADVMDIIREAIVAYDFSDDAVDALGFVQTEVEGLLEWDPDDDEE